MDLKGKGFSYFFPEDSLSGLSERHALEEDQTRTASIDHVFVSTTERNLFIYLFIYLVLMNNTPLLSLQTCFGRYVCHLQCDNCMNVFIVKSLVI